jgi:hypothetical protein
MTSASAPIDYFAALCQGLHGQPNRKGEVYTKCPNCGKGDQHFSYSREGAYCFKCGYKPSLRTLAEQLLGGRVFAPAALPAPAPAKPRPWQSQAWALALSFTQTPGTVAAWQAYKPLPADVIARRRLGLGVFPGGLAYKQGGQWLRCEHRRLIVPLFSGRDAVAGFRCRAIECDHKKWLSPGGTEMVLYNAAHIRRGQPLTVLENPIDALLVHYQWGEAAVATMGVTIWKDHYTRQVAQAGPSVVVFAFDNDHVGPEWNARHARELRAAGLPAQAFDWSQYPGMKDFGDFFIT